MRLTYRHAVQRHQGQSRSLARVGSVCRSRRQKTRSSCRQSSGDNGTCRRTPLRRRVSSPLAHRDRMPALGAMSVARPRVSSCEGFRMVDQQAGRPLDARRRAEGARRRSDGIAFNRGEVSRAGDAAARNANKSVPLFLTRIVGGTLLRSNYLKSLVAPLVVVPRGGIELSSMS
jgi:hypothetical protein